jgi:hypothetical protein
MEDRRIACRVLVEKCEGRENLEVLVYDVKMDLQEVGWEGMGWTDRAQDRGWWGGLL